MGSSLVRITKWVYVNHILLYHLLLFFPLLPILCCTTRSCYTDVSGGQNDTCHSEITLTVRALPAFLMLSGRDVDSSHRISFKAAWGSYHSLRNLGLQSLQCPFRRNPGNAGNPSNQQGNTKDTEGTHVQDPKV